MPIYKMEDKNDGKQKYNGDCILLDCICPQTITFSHIICKWFRSAVLPLDKELHIELEKPPNTKQCIICGKDFVYKSNKAMYCNYCKKTVLRRQAAQRKRKQRELSRNRE